MIPLCGSVCVKIYSKMYASHDLLSIVLQSGGSGLILGWGLRSCMLRGIAKRVILSSFMLIHGGRERRRKQWKIPFPWLFSLWWYICAHSLLWPLALWLPHRFYEWWRNTEGVLALESFGSVGVVLNVVIGVMGKLKKKKKRWQGCCPGVTKWINAEDSSVGLWYWFHGASLICTISFVSLSFLITTHLGGRWKL